MRQSVLSDSLAIRYGIRFGIAIAVLCLGLGATVELVGLQAVPAVASIFGCIFAIFLFWVLGEAGHWTAERTGTVGSGVLAGTLAGGFGGLGYTLAAYATKFIVHPTPAFVLIVVLGMMVTLLENVCLLGGLGAACGAFGASIGKPKYYKRQAARLSPALPPDAPTPA